MRYIKLALISLVVFSVLISLFSLFFPANVRISKAIDINASRETVQKQIPAIDSVISMGKSAKTGWNILESGIPGTVTVQGYIDFYLGWLPWQKFSSLLLEKRYGPLLEKGLEQLKQRCE